MRLLIVLGVAGLAAGCGGSGEGSGTAIRADQVMSVGWRGELHDTGPAMPCDLSPAAPGATIVQGAIQGRLLEFVVSQSTPDEVVLQANAFSQHGGESWWVRLRRDLNQDHELFARWEHQGGLLGRRSGNGWFDRYTGQAASASGAPAVLVDLATGETRSGWVVDEAR